MVRTALSSTSRLLLAAVLTALWAALPASAHAQTTALFLDSQPGEALAQGVDYNYSAPTHAFQLTGNSRNGVTISVKGGTAQCYAGSRLHLSRMDRGL